VRVNADDQRQLDRVIEIVQDVLGDDVAGAYLFGSAVLGALRPESDLDVLVVARRPVALREKERLVKRLLEISGRETPAGRWRRVEVTVVSEQEIRPWRYPPRMDFQYGDWLRGAFASCDPGPWQARECSDLASLVTMTLLADTTLVGPPPADLLDPVPHADLLEATAGDLDGIVAGLEDDDTRNVILTLARIWRTTATGEIVSKDAAADWALERLPEEHRTVLARARAVYLGDEEERWDDLEPQLRPHIAYVRTEIERCRRTGPDSLG
jgi:streptomycin 3"-adenylyltransferase